MRIVIVPRVLSVAVAMMLAPGCATVIRPYIDSPTVGEVGTSGNAGAPARMHRSKPDPTRFDPIPDREAVRYALATQDRMQRAAHQHAMTATGSGAALIPLASLIAYKGFAGAGSHNIAALSTAGAAALGVTNWVYRPRDVVYLSGAAAIHCAIDVTAPAIIPDSIWNEFHSGRARIAETSHALESSVTRSVNARSLVGAARTALRVAAIDIGRARLAGVGISAEASETEKLAARLNVLTAALDDLETRRNDLGARLVDAAKSMETKPQRDHEARRALISATRRIIGEVNLQLTSDRPDPAKLAALVPQLKLPVKQAAMPTTDAKQPAAASEAVKKISALATAEGGDLKTMQADGPMQESPLLQKATRSVAAAGEAVARAAEELGLLRSDLDLVETRVSEIVAATRAISITSDELAGVVEQCGLERSMPTPLALATPDAGARIKPGGSIRLPIVGGVKPYAAVVPTPPAEGSLTVEIVEGLGNSRTLVLSASKPASAGTYAVIVQDARGKVASMDVAIDTAQP